MYPNCHNLSMYGIWFPMAEMTYRQILKGELEWWVSLDEGVSAGYSPYTEQR